MTVTLETVFLFAILAHTVGFVIKCVLELVKLNRSK